MRNGISRRTVLAGLGAGLAGSTSFTAGSGELLRATGPKLVVLDMQGGLPSDWEEADAVRAARESGVTAISVTVGLVGNGPDRLKSVLDDIAYYENQIDANPQVFTRIRQIGDIEAARDSGRMGIMYNIQDTSALEGDLTRIRLLKGLGVRALQLTYNKRNLVGDGCLEPDDAGLSDFGRAVIHETQSNRLLLDLSHGGPQTIFEAVREAKLPPAVTHTGCRDLVNNPRNIYDRELRAVATKGGVVGIYFMSYLRVGIGGKAVNGRGEDVLRHIQHAFNVCGEDHIGIGTDGNISTLVETPALRKFYKEKFDSRVSSGFYTPGDAPDVYNYIPDYNMPTRLGRLGHDLTRRGWTTRQVEKLLGGNFHRLLQDAMRG